MTTLIGIPIILGLVAIGGWPFAFVAAGVASLAAREAFHALGHPGSSQPWRLALPMVGAFALTVLAAVSQTALLACLLCLLLLFASSPLADSKFVEWPLAFTATLYAALPLALLVLLRTDGSAAPHVQLWKVSVADGAVQVLLVLTTAWAVDVVAYVVGRLVGSHLLWPRVSPKKTWEGTTAGVLAGVLLWLAWAPSLDVPMATAALIGLLAALAAIVGDLAESAIKRSAGLKDTGALIPGHGGLLDRLDSLGFVAVVVFVCGVVAHF